MEPLDLGYLFIAVQLLLIGLLALPLPSSVVITFSSLKPAFWLFLAAVIVSGASGFDGISSLLSYKPRVGEAVQYESDPRFLNALVLVLKAAMVFVTLFCFVVAQHLALQRAKLSEKVKKSELNRLATQKQAQAASKQTLAMLEELDKLKKGSETAKTEGAESLDQDDLKKALKQTSERLEEAELKAKIIQENYVKLVEEYSSLESSNVNKKESKKNK